MSNQLWATDDSQRAVEVGQRALALAETMGNAALQVVMHLVLGRVYHALGDYPQAIDLLRQNVVSLEGALLPGALRPAGAALGDVSCPVGPVSR